MSKKEDRLNRLIEILKRQNGATIRDLAQMLDVSEMTVRRDLDALKAKERDTGHSGCSGPEYPIYV